MPSRGLRQGLQLGQGSRLQIATVNVGLRLCALPAWLRTKRTILRKLAALFLKPTVRLRDVVAANADEGALFGIIP